MSKTRKRARTMSDDDMLYVGGVLMPRREYDDLTLEKPLGRYVQTSAESDVTIGETIVTCGQADVGIGREGLTLDYAEGPSYDQQPALVSVEEAGDLIRALRAAIDEKLRRDAAGEWPEPKSEPERGEMHPFLQALWDETDRLNLMCDGSGGTFRGIGE